MRWPARRAKRATTAPQPVAPTPGQVVLTHRGRSTVATRATVLEVLDGSALVEFQHVPVVQVVPLADIREVK